MHNLYLLNMLNSIRFNIKKSSFISKLKKTFLQTYYYNKFNRRTEGFPMTKVCKDNRQYSHKYVSQSLTPFPQINVLNQYTVGYTPQEVISDNLYVQSNFQTHQKSLNIIPERYVPLLKKQIDRYKKVDYPNFALKHRQIVKKHSRTYLVSYFDKDIGQKLSDYIQTKKLTLGVSKYIIMKVLTFCQYLKTINLHFIKDIEQHIFVKQVSIYKIEVYFTNIDFTFDFESNLNFKHKKVSKQTIFTENSSLLIERTLQDIVQQDSETLIIKSLFGKMLNNCAKNNESVQLNPYIYYKIQMLANQSKSYSQALQSFQIGQIQLKNEILLLTFCNQPNNGKIQFQIINKKTKTSINKIITQDQIQQTEVGQSSLQLLFCQLSMRTQKDVYLENDYYICLYLNGNQIKLFLSQDYQNPIDNNLFQENKLQNLLIRPENGQGKTNIKTAYNSQQYPENCVVKVVPKFLESIHITQQNITAQCSEQAPQYGTGTLISSRIVLTCAHVISTQYLWRNRRSNITLAHSINIEIDNKQISVKAMFVPKLYTRYSLQSSATNQYDYALLLLNQPVPRPKYLKIAKKYRTQSKIYLPINNSLQKLNKQNQIRSDILSIQDKTSNFIKYNQPTQKGQSGTPIYIQFADDNSLKYICAIHTGAQYIKDNMQLKCKKGVKFHQKLVSHILKFQQIYIDNQVEKFIKNSAIQLQRICESMQQISNQNLHYLNYVIARLCDKRQSYNQNSQRSKNINSKQFHVQQLLERLSISFRSDNIQTPTKQQLKYLQAKLIEIFIRYNINSQKNAFANSQSYIELKYSLNQSPILKMGFLQLIKLNIQHQELFKFLISKLQQILIQVIQIQENNRVIVFNPLQTYQKIISNLLKFFELSFPSLFALYSIAALRGNIFRQQKTPYPQLCRRRCFNLIRWLTNIAYYINPSNQMKRLRMHCVIMQHEYDRRSNQQISAVLSQQKHSLSAKKPQLLEFPSDIQCPFRYFDSPLVDYQYGNYSQIYHILQNTVQQDQIRQMYQFKNIYQYKNKIKNVSIFTRLPIHHKTQIIYQTTSKTYPGYSIVTYLNYWDYLPFSLFIKIAYQAIELLISLHQQNIYLLCPLQFCTVIQKKGCKVKFIYLGEYELLRSTIQKHCNQSNRKSYMRYYPLNLLKQKNPSSIVKRSIDTAILVRSLLRWNTKQQRGSESTILRYIINKLNYLQNLELFEHQQDQLRQLLMYIQDSLGIENILQSNNFT